MKIKNAKFLISSPSLSLCPKSNLAEFALLGRSNVGKSSFINSFVNQSKLAKTSNTPGKTRLINLFEVETDAKPFILADLPGYGYAKVSKKEQDFWQKNLENYLLKRENLVSTIQFIDARHDIQNNDYLMQQWLKHNNIKCFNIMTKCDYISKNEMNKKLSIIKKEFKNETFIYSTKSSLRNAYGDEILKHIFNLIG